MTSIHQLLNHLKIQSLPRSWLSVSVGAIGLSLCFAQPGNAGTKTFLNQNISVKADLPGNPAEFFYI